MTNEDILRDRLAAAVDETDRMRAVADRLAEDVENAYALANNRWDEWSFRATCVRDAIQKALDEYRKSVADAR